MTKLAITGGGRCNLTNDFQGIRSLSEAYPRGERVMARALKSFSQQDTCHWFEAHGVPLVLQPDHCWFPRSQNALDVVQCLLHALQGTILRLNTRITALRSFVADAPQDDSKWCICHSECTPCHSECTPCHSEHTPCHSECIPCHSEHTPCHSERSEESHHDLYDFVVVTTGGAPKGLPFLEGLDLELIPPVPSLFTFNIPDKNLTALMGLVTDASVSLPGTGFRAAGPLLITDWGLSGPAVLKLSSYAARHLAACDYKGNVAVNWLDLPETQARALLQRYAAEQPQKQVSTAHPLQARLWAHLMERAGLRPDIRWAELGSKGLNRLTAVLTQDTYPLNGKSRFREEFVTAGGVALSNIDLNTLECKKHPGLYFAGEVLDIDAITGGFNLQAAWSTAYVCAKSIAACMDS